MKEAIENILLYLFLPSIIYIIFDLFNIKISIILISLISYLLLLTYYIFKYKKILLHDIKTFKKKYIKNIIKYWVIGFILMVLANFIINYLIFNNRIASNESANRDMLLNNKLLYSFMLCILIPIIEEITFRLEFKKNIKNYKYFLIVSSLLFSLVHVISSNLIEYIYIVPYFILGFTFSFIYYKNNNIITNILAHVIHNSITVTILLIFL